jgi:hypothetical protein
MRNSSWLSKSSSFSWMTPINSFNFSFCCMFKLAKRASKLSSSSLELSSSLDVVYLVEALDFTFLFLSSFAMRHLWSTLGKRRPLLTAVGVSTPGVPGLTSKLSLRAPAQMGRRETEHKEEENRGFLLSCAQGGCACSRGLQAFARERERESLSVSLSSRAATSLCTRALDLPFIDVRRGSRCIMGGVAIC